MSTYTDASLIVTPNAYKAGKLYSLKPTDGSGDLGVVRATTATRVNSEGLIESVAINEPRLDYTNGSCPSILVEPQRTNLIPNANGYTGNSVYYTITTNQSSPDGLNNAVLFVEKTSTSPYSINSVTATILPNTQYTYSFFVKYAGIQFIPINASDGLSGFGATFDALNGVMSSGVGIVQQYQDGWYRVSLTRTSGATANTGTITHGFGVKTGDGVSGFYFFGNQIEAGANATSYIPTIASAVTRNADVISKTGISDLINSREGVLFANIKALTNPATAFSGISLGSTSNRILFRFSNAANIINVVIVTNSVVEVNIFYNSFNNYASDFNKIALKYKDNDVSLYINGVKVSESLSCTMPDENAISTLLLADGSSSSASFNSFFGNINVLSVFPNSLTDEQLIELTTL